MELCVKNTGYSAVQITVAAATASFATYRAKRHTPVSAKAATSNMAMRVTAGVNPLNFHQKASQSITSGGCALESVVCGINEPVSSMSCAARNEVSGLVPEVRQAKKGRVQDEQAGEDQRECQQLIARRGPPISRRRGQGRIGRPGPSRLPQLADHGFSGSVRRPD